MEYFGWKPYVPVAVRRQKASRLAAVASRSGSALSPVPASRGAIASTFWGKSWCDNLEHYSDFSNRLPRGRTYVRSGAVIDLQIAKGEVHAKVVGSSLYNVTIRIAPVPQAKWQALCGQCAGSIHSLVDILQGRLSGPVMEHMCKPGTGLFPAPAELNFDCSCPDWASMCKHVAAVLYGVGARLDRQPELLFTLRHVDAKDLVSEAGTGLQKTAKPASAGKVLRDVSLADVFGIELVDDTAPSQASTHDDASAVVATTRPESKRGRVGTRPPRPPAPKPALSRKVANKKTPTKAAALKPVKTKPAASKRSVAKSAAAKRIKAKTATAKSPVAAKTPEKKPSTGRSSTVKATPKSPARRQTSTAKL